MAQTHRVIVTEQLLMESYVQTHYHQQPLQPLRQHQGHPIQHVNRYLNSAELSDVVWLVADPNVTVQRTL